MANLRFTASVHHESQAIVPVSNYPGLLVPPGVPVHEPIAISFARMSQLAPDKFPAPAGLTVATGELSMKLQGTWKPTETAPVMWKWQGGDMQLDVTVAVYIIDKYQPVKKLFEVILSHELMHWEDDIDIVIDEKDITDVPMYLRARNYGISYLPQEPSVFRKLTVEENILAVLEAQPISWH